MAKARHPTKTPQKTQTLETPSENQGEGNKTADKAYRDAAAKFAKSHDTASQAREAERDVEAHPKEYAEAERKGKSKSAGEDPDES